MTLRNDELIELLFSVLLPPVGVFLRRGCGPDLVVNILLTVLGYIPGKKSYFIQIYCVESPFSYPFALHFVGIIHAVWIILYTPPVANAPFQRV